MWLTVTDALTRTEYYYWIPDAPTRLILTEETQHLPRCRFVYRVSTAPLENAREIAFAEFASMMYFDLAFEAISPDLLRWLESV